MEARLRNNLGHLKRRTGNMSEALELLENSLAYFTEVSPNEFWASGVLFNIGRVHNDLGDNSRALNAFNRSLELRTPDCDPVGRAESLHEIATIGSLQNAPWGQAFATWDSGKHRPGEVFSVDVSGWTLSSWSNISAWETDGCGDRRPSEKS